VVACHAALALRCRGTAAPRRGSPLTAAGRRSHCAHPPLRLLVGRSGSPIGLPLALPAQAMDRAALLGAPAARTRPEARHLSDLRRAALGRLPAAAARGAWRAT